MDVSRIEAVAPAPQPALRHYALALALAILGGLLGLVGAFFEEVRAGGLVLLPIVGAPIIEEVLKPSGIYLLLSRWAYVVRNQVQIAALTAISGLTFGLLESLVYVTVYHRHHSGAFVVYRFTVTVLLHATSSFIAGLGINRRLFDWANGKAPFPKASRNAFVAAILLHGAYNTVVIALSIAGVLDFS